MMPCKSIPMIQMSQSDFMELALLNQIFAAVDPSFPASWYFGLSTADPGEDEAGLAEPSGNGYARVTFTRNATNFPAAAAGSIDNGVAITFPQATGSWGNCTYMCFFDAITTGNMMGSVALDTPRTITSGMTPSFAIGSFIASMT